MRLRGTNSNRGAGIESRDYRKQAILQKQSPQSVEALRA